MRTVVVSVTMALLVVAGWLWYQVRDVQGSWNLDVVETQQSRLVEARAVEAMLREGRVDEALSHLQRSRDLRVLQLASTRSAIGMTSWHSNRNKYTLEKAVSLLREEAEYRRTVGD